MNSERIIKTPDMTNEQYAALVEARYTARQEEIAREIRVEHFRAKSWIRLG